MREQETLPTGEVKAVDSAVPDEAIEQAAQEQELRRQGKRDRLQKMREYAETGECRRALLLNYLGDAFEGPCGNCDNCDATGNGSVEQEAGTRREVR